MPSLAFVGSEVSTFNNILTAHVQARWLAHYLGSASKQCLSSAKMEDYVNRDQEWKRSWMQKSSSRASLIQLHMIKYHDILLDDLGLASTGHTHWWQRWFLPQTARDVEFTTYPSATTIPPGAIPPRRQNATVS